MVTFNNTKTLDGQQLAKLKLKTKEMLPGYLIDFFIKYSDSIPTYNSKPCEFKIIHPDGYVQVNYIEKIVGLEGIFAEFGDRETLNLYMRWQDLSKDFAEIEYLCPFAYAPNGVFYCSVAGLHNGKIYFADNGDFGILFVKNSFEEFWNSVQ